MKIRFTKTALRQIEEALSYLKRRSPRAAAGLSERILTVTSLVRDYPEATQATSRAGVRRAVLTPFPYVLFYRVTSDEIIVMRLRHLARRPTF